MTVTESIWNGLYKCNDWNCNDELIGAMKRVFDMYMKEKKVKYPNNPHYRAISSWNLSKIWFWVSIKEKKNNYYDFYITTHYCSNLKN